MKPKGKKLKGYSIKTKIIIEEHREKYKEGDGYYQPLECYSYSIDDGYCKKSQGGFKTKKQLIKAVVKEI